MTEPKRLCVADPDRWTSEGAGAIEYALAHCAACAWLPTCSREDVPADFEGVWGGRAYSRGRFQLRPAGGLTPAEIRAGVAAYGRGERDDHTRHCRAIYARQYYAWRRARAKDAS